MLIARVAFGIWRTGCSPAGFSRFRHPRGAVSVLKLASKVEVEIVLLVRREVQRNATVTHFLLVIAVHDFIFCAA